MIDIEETFSKVKVSKFRETVYYENLKEINNKNKFKKI